MVSEEENREESGWISSNSSAVQPACRLMMLHVAGTATNTALYINSVLSAFPRLPARACPPAAL